MDYYDGLRKELLAKREQIRSLTRQSKIQGDYYESLIRDFVRKFVSERFEIAYGLICDEKGHRSRECDAIIYEKDRRPLLKYQNLVIVNCRDVWIVMQVKSILTSGTLRDAITNLNAVKTLNRNIMCWIVGFETDVLLKTLYLKAWESRSVQFLNAFQTRRKTEDKEFLESQMKFFVDHLELHTEPRSSQMQDLVIYDAEREYGWIALQEHEKEQKIQTILSDIYSKGFWSMWNSEYKV